MYVSAACMEPYLQQCLSRDVGVATARPEDLATGVEREEEEDDKDDAEDGQD